MSVFYQMEQGPDYVKMERMRTAAGNQSKIVRKARD